VGKRRCPNCGRRAPDGVVCCRDCGHSIPIEPLEHARNSPLKLALGGWSDESAADPADELGLLTAECPACGSRAPGDEYIDDPELLERAEEDVRRLPLRLPFTEPIKDPTADKAGEPRPVGWECPACGGQAQRGWKTCPWCHRPLPAYIWEPEGQDPGD
jgi:hypothetical protein